MCGRLRLNPKVHLWEHVASDGSVLRMSINISTKDPVVTTDTPYPKAAAVAQKEYAAWASYVSEEMFDLLTPEQQLMFALRGMERLCKNQQ